MTARFPTVIAEFGFGLAPASTYIVFYKSQPRSIGGVGPAGVGFNTFTFAPSTTYTDVSADYRMLSTRRGRQRAMDQFSAGTSSVTLDATTTDYWTDPSAVPNIPTRYRATWNGVTYPLFAGFVDAWTPNYTPGQGSYSEVVARATDGLRVLQGYQPFAGGGTVGVGEDTGSRVSRVLDEAGWSATDRLLDAGISTLQGTTLSQTALSDAQAAVDSELGRLYMTADGLVRFENRWYRWTNPSSMTPQFVFADNDDDAQSYGSTYGVGSDVYQSAVPANDNTLVKNKIGARNDGGTLQTAIDDASVAANYTTVYQNTSLLLQDDASAQHWANQVLFFNKNAEKRVDQIVIKPSGNPDVLWPEVLSRQISDMISVIVDGDEIQCWVEGIDHEAQTSPMDWTTTYSLSQVPSSLRSDTSPFMIFDSGMFNVNSFAEF
jgi:hypothetical protein